MADRHTYIISIIGIMDGFGDSFAQVDYESIVIVTVKVSDTTMIIHAVL